MGISTADFTANIGQASTYNLRMYRGETVTMTVFFVDAGGPVVMPNTTAELLWQPEGTETPEQWWRRPAKVERSTVTAELTPDMFGPAARYRFFLRVVNGESICYRANGVIILAASPGEVPGEMPPPPPPVIDFDKVTIVHAPWLLPEDLVAGTDNVTIAPSPDGKVTISVTGGSGSGIPADVANTLLTALTEARTVKDIKLGLVTFISNFTGGGKN